MSNANDFIIENGILTKYVGPGGAVIVPEEVTEIGIKAFASGGYQVSSTITSIQFIFVGVSSPDHSQFKILCINHQVSNPSNSISFFSIIILL